MGSGAEDVMLATLRLNILAYKASVLKLRVETFDWRLSNENFAQGPSLG